MAKNTQSPGSITILEPTLIFASRTRITLKGNCVRQLQTLMYPACSKAARKMKVRRGHFALGHPHHLETNWAIAVVFGVSTCICCAGVQPGDRHIHLDDQSTRRADRGIRARGSLAAGILAETAIEAYRVMVDHQDFRPLHGPHTGGATSSTSARATRVTGAAAKAWHGMTKIGVPGWNCE